MALQAFSRALVRWFGRERRDLPWRRNANPYRVWVSETMLQQTRVDTVIPYFGRFLRRFPTLRKLASASVEDVLKAWEGLGYYARARNLHRAARILVGEHGAKFPETADEWATLPGVGEYTAAAIASVAYGETVPVIDGNVRRVVARLRMSEDPARMRRFLTEAIRGQLPGDFNQAMMELGQAVCVPRAPHCLFCPVRRHCAAFREGVVDRFPAQKEARPIPHFEIAVGICRKRGRILVARRREEGLLGGLWEFPGGKIEPGERSDEAVRRELLEEAGIEVEVGEKVAVVRHRYSHFSVRLHAHLCRWKRGRAEARASAAVRWMKPAGLDSLAFPAANRRILEAMRAQPAVPSKLRPSRRGATPARPSPEPPSQPGLFSEAELGPAAVR